MRVTARTVFFGIEIPLDRFSALAAQHVARVKHTADIEAFGRLLISRKFPKADVDAFVRRVCGWGGYAGVAGRVLKQNDVTEIRRFLSSALEQLTISPPNIASAVQLVNRLRGLGQLSFASKHLRFLRPDLCPVFDSFLQSALPYTSDAAGYAGFAEDCGQLAAELTRLGIHNPRPGRGGRWLVANAEASIFEYVRQRASSSGLNGE